MNLQPMKQPKILFISYAFYPSMGGIEVNSAILTDYFHLKGYDLKLVTMVEEEGNRKFPFPVFRNPGLSQLCKLHKWADLVFENNPSLRLAWPRLFFTSTSVIALCGRISRDDGKLAVQDRLKGLALRNADAVVAVSAAIRDKFCSKAIIIGNPYRHDLFLTLDRDRKPLNFVFLGRLVSEKGVDLAIGAFKRIVDKVSSEKTSPLLKIIGDGPELEPLREIVKINQLQNKVLFLGRKDGTELVEILNTCNYMLIPTRWEAFGNVALEGMACGCLPIVSDTGGLPDAVGEAGVKFKYDSNKTTTIDALTSAIMEILDNPALEASYRSKMKQHLQEHQAERVAEKYLSVIEMAYQKSKKAKK